MIIVIYDIRLAHRRLAGVDFDKSTIYYDDGLIQLLSIHLDRNIIVTLLGSLFVGKLSLQTYLRSSHTNKCM